MKPKSISVHHIPSGGDVLDAIDVFIAWYGEQAFQITIRCWDQAWTGYRGGHWYEQAEKYLTECVDKGLIDHLVSLFSRTQSHKERKWLKNIIGSIHKHLKSIEVA